MSRISIHADPRVFNVLIDAISLVSVLITVLLLTLWQRNRAWLLLINGQGFKFHSPGVIISGGKCKRWSLGWFLTKAGVVSIVLVPLIMDFLHVIFDLNVEYEQVVSRKTVEGYKYGSRGTTTPSREITCAWMKVYEVQQQCLKNHPLCDEYYFPAGLAGGENVAPIYTRIASECPTVKTTWDGIGRAPAVSKDLVDQILVYFKCRDIAWPVYDRFQVVGESLVGRDPIGNLTTVFSNNWREELSTGRISFESTPFGLRDQNASEYTYPMCLVPTLDDVPLPVTGGHGFEVMYKNAVDSGFVTNTLQYSLLLDTKALMASVSPGCAEIIDTSAAIHLSSIIRGLVPQKKLRSRSLHLRIVSKRKPDAVPETHIFVVSLAGMELLADDLPVVSSRTICGRQEFNVPSSTEFVIGAMEIRPAKQLLTSSAKSIRILSFTPHDRAKALDADFDPLGFDTLLRKGPPLSVLVQPVLSFERSLVMSGIQLNRRGAYVNAGVQEILPTATPFGIGLWVVSFVPLVVVAIGAMVSWLKVRYHPCQPIEINVPMTAKGMIKEWSGDLEGSDTVIGINAGDRALRCRPTRNPVASRSATEQEIQLTAADGA